MSYAYGTQLKSKEDQMSKTAREVMTPAGAWPDDALGDAATARLSGGGLHGQAAGAGDPPAIGADDWIDQALVTMTQLKVRRLPVVDRGRLVGVISQGDLARSIDEPETWSRLCS